MLVGGVDAQLRSSTTLGSGQSRFPRVEKVNVEMLLTFEIVWEGHLEVGPHRTPFVQGSAS